MALLLSVLSPVPSDEIIDVGCNTGDAERLLVQDYPKIASVVGIEKNRRRYERATARCKNDGAPGQIVFKLADAQDLPFDDRSFDKAFCVETLEWVEDPSRALREIRRVLRPSGKAVIVHSDFDTQVFNAQDKKLCRRIVHSFTDSGPSGQMGRELYGLCRSAGFSSVNALVYTLVNTKWSPNFYSYRVAHMMIEWLTTKSLVPRNELERWLTDLREQSSRGLFFYSIKRYIFNCLK